MRGGSVFGEALLIEFYKRFRVDMSGFVAWPYMEVDGDGVLRCSFLAVPSDNIKKISSLFFCVVKGFEEEGGEMRW